MTTEEHKELLEQAFEAGMHFVHFDDYENFEEWYEDNAKHLLEEREEEKHEDKCNHEYEVSMGRDIKICINCGDVI